MSEDLKSYFGVPWTREVSRYTLTLSGDYMYHVLWQRNLCIMPKGCLKWNCVNPRRNGDYFPTALTIGLPNAACPRFWEAGHRLREVHWVKSVYRRFLPLAHSWSCFHLIESQDCAMAQVFFLRHLNQGDRVNFEAFPCGICGGKSDNETGFSPGTSNSSCQYHLPVLHTCSLVCHRRCIILVHRVK